MSGELERFDPGEQGGRIAYEHLHRYALCREYVAGKRVLDLACGTGYGTAILGSTGAEVTGVDISADAIKIARRRNTGDNVKFLIADCFDLPFESRRFDVVVANEMIEHVADHDGLLQEARRVLAPGGLLLVSTPNKPVYNRFKTPNIFHVSEMEMSEFQRLLDRHFRHVRLTGLRMALVSASYPLNPATTGNLDAARIHVGNAGSDGQPQMSTGELQLADPEYVLAACSDDPLEDLPLPSSLFFSPGNDLWLEHERIMAWASGLHEEDENLRAEVARSRSELVQERENLAALKAEQASQVQFLANLQRANSELGAAVQRERDIIRREGEGQRRLLSRLLGQASDSNVGDDEASIVAGLFALNTTLVEERLRREMAEQKTAHQDAAVAAALAAVEKAQAARETAERECNVALGDAHRTHQQLADLETAMDAAIDRQGKLQASLDAVERERDAALGDANRTHQQLADLETAMDAAIDRQGKLQASLDAVERERDVAIGDANRTHQQLADLETAMDAAIDRQGKLQASLDTVERERDAALDDANRTHQQLADRDAAIVTARHELAAHMDEITQLQSALTEVRRGAVSVSTNTQQAAMQVAAAQKARPDPEPARHIALTALHQRVASELADAPRRVVGRIGPPAPPPPRSLRQSLLGRPAPLHTQIFSQDWLERQQNRAGRLSLAAFLSDQACQRLDPHPLFAASAYLDGNPDMAAAGMAPLLHYVKHGWREGRNPHPLFPNDWYLAQNPDVAADGSLNPLDHYLQYGWREGRWPNPLFDPRAYLDRYPDVAASGSEPLTHFLMYGQNEGREPPFLGWDPEWTGLNETGGLMRRLMTTAPPQAPVAIAKAAWPPSPLDDFWPPQKMRDFILDGYGETVLDRCWYLLSLMQRWQERQAEFAGSDDCNLLLVRLRERAALRALPAGRQSDATIIIPVYNNILDTLICLASLLELDEAHDFDVIMADDGSSDATAALVGTIGGVVRHLRQPQNLGFLGNCNAAAVQAQGRHIILLNNDTLVFPGWLDGLLTPFTQFERVGLVGSKLINWDGTLQEAGGIFWRDGSAWNFGRNQDPRAPEFSYLKDVDYCSGASIAVPAALWRTLGGFDPAYTPAYCEDSDLAFRLRDAGYRTLYNPTSEVLHHEGRSHGRDVASGIKAYQVTNQKRLFERWRPELERDHYPNAHNVLRARDRSFNKRHVLVIDHYVPQWDRDAGSRTIYEFMRVLLESGHSVTFWPDNLWRDPDYTPKLQALGIEVIYGPRFVDGFADFMIERTDFYDMVLLSRPHIAVHYMDAVKRHSQARIVYYGHDVHFRRMMAQRMLEGRPAEDADVAAMRAQELAVCNSSDLVLYPSAEEAKMMGALINTGISARAISAYRYKTDELATARATAMERMPTSGPLRLLFVGGFAHPPNTDAITWFCRDVLPLIEAKGRSTQLQIVGSKAGPEVKALQRQGVDVLGFVSDAQLLCLYKNADIVIAPLRYGAGVKGKVIEAMARGVPVATTDIGAQGIDNADQFLFIGNSAQEFSSAVIAAGNADEAQKRALAGIAFISAHYSTQAMREILEAGFSPLSAEAAKGAK
jgi:GT2 family glycosyltransferase/SAM-dependent methyltransferase